MIEALIGLTIGIPLGMFIIWLWKLEPEPVPEWRQRWVDSGRPDRRKRTWIERQRDSVKTVLDEGSAYIDTLKERDGDGRN